MRLRFAAILVSVCHDNREPCMELARFDIAVAAVDSFQQGVLHQVVCSIGVEDITATDVFQHRDGFHKPTEEIIIHCDCSFFGVSYKCSAVNITIDTALLFTEF